MTLTTLNTRNSYPGPGSGPFAFTYRILAPEDLQVIKRSALGIETVLALTTNYTVSGAGNATGSVTLVTALVSGETIIIRRRPPNTQPISIRNQGTYFPATIEDELDRLAMQLQAVQDQADRSFRVSDSYDPAALTLSGAPGSAGQVLGWTTSSLLGPLTLATPTGVALPGFGRTVPTLSAYLANNAFLNPLDYGVTGDGVTDDTAAWQALILRARNQANQVGIALPLNHFYKISAPLSVGGVSIIGLGGSSLATQFFAASNFVGNFLMIVDGDTVGGAGRELYANFWLNGSKSAGVVCGGLQIRKSCVYNIFSNIAVTSCKLNGIQFSGTTGFRPTCNVFDVLTSRDNDGDGWEIRAGWFNSFRCCGSEQNYKINWDVNSLDEIVASLAMERCWSEFGGFTSTLGYNPAGQDAYYFSLCDAAKIVQCNATGYGSNPVGTGHAYNLQSCNRCEIDAGDASYNYSGASGASSKKYNIVSGARNRVKWTGGSVAAADLNIAAGDTIIENAWVNAIGNDIQTHTSNAWVAIPANTTIYLQPQTGFYGAVEANASVIVCGRMFVERIAAKCRTTPTAGQTYTITLMKNGVATGLVVTLTNANFAAGALSSSAEVYFVDGDTYSFRVVSSITAANILAGDLVLSLGYRQ